MHLKISIVLHLAALAVVLGQLKAVAAFTPVPNEPPPTTQGSGTR